jgi:hypothetical protein
VSRHHAVDLQRLHGSGDAVYRSLRAMLPRPGGPHGHRSTDDHDLHVDADAVCPRCLTWIQPSDHVRRTAYGPYQHESC